MFTVPPIQVDAMDDRAPTRAAPSGGPTHDPPVVEAGDLQAASPPLSSVPVAARPQPASPAGSGLRASRVPAVRRSAAGSSLVADGDRAPGIVHDVLRSPGVPLSEDQRRTFEGGLGADLSGVRLHTGPRAQESAAAVGSAAYTVGRDIVLGREAPAPGTPAGRRMLAHELAHVVQQGQGARSDPSELRVGAVDDPLEREAHRFANGSESTGPVRQVASSRATKGVTGTGAPALQRWGTARPLTASEISILTRVYGTHLDYTKMQINENSLLAADGVQRTTGNTINIPGTTLTIDTLVHEAGHVYQNQRGDHYILSSLYAQAAAATHGSRSAAYDYSREVAAHVPFDNWNSEQQAQWIEDNMALPPTRRGAAGYP
jgi:hypothetical protein